MFAFILLSSHDKSVFVKTKPFNRQIVISINQLFKLHNICPQPWLSLAVLFIIIIITKCTFI